MRRTDHPRAVGEDLLVQHIHNWDLRRNRGNGAEKIFEEIRANDTRTQICKTQGTAQWCSG